MNNTAPTPADPTARPLAPAAPTLSWQTLQVATVNTLNLALPDQHFYPGQDPYDRQEHERKLAWLGGMVARLGADIYGFQEVWHEAALKAVVARSGLHLHTVLAPGAEEGATGTPRLGLATRLHLEAIESLVDFAASDHVIVPELGPYTRFERPVLHARLRTQPGTPLHVLVVHLKSKRPKYLQDAQGQPLEDRDDPLVTARATLRSLLMRAAEAAALRRLVVDITSRRGSYVSTGGEPLVLLGDMNDGPHSVTSQMIAATQAVAYDRGARDVALYHAWDVATDPALKRDLAYSHVHQGWPELLDQIWVSEEFVASSKFAIGDVRRVDVFNDHLQESRERWRSDHGFVRALLRLRSG
jgi:endonuclease/exonuclease/phosphatase family metal-dependent hydrolase